jgi:hypothetical protein
MRINHGDVRVFCSAPFFYVMPSLGCDLVHNFLDELS